MSADHPGSVEYPTPSGESGGEGVGGVPADQAAVVGLAYARLLRPDTVTAVSLAVDDEVRELNAAWEAADPGVALHVVESPYREIIRPIIKYVRDYPARGPRDVMTVIIPEYVIGHWWEQLLHNQSALRLRSRLLFQPGVVVIDVPWHLRSAGVTPRPNQLHHTLEQQAAAAEHPDTSSTGTTDDTPPSDAP